MSPSILGERARHEYLNIKYEGEYSVLVIVESLLKRL